MHIQYQEIIEALKRELPGADSHKKMLPKNRKLKIPGKGELTVKKSSVLMLLFPDNGEIKMCLIKRPVHMKHHAGQIAFPGGRIEKDETALETALRESQEEIGIEPDIIKILGTLSELYVEVSGFLIYPFVGWLDKKPTFRINKNEVEKIILFPVFNHYAVHEWVELDTIKGNQQVPCLIYNSEIIWGATAMILSEFYDVTNHLHAIQE